MQKIPYVKELLEIIDADCSEITQKIFKPYEDELRRKDFETSLDKFVKFTRRKLVKNLIFFDYLSSNPDDRKIPQENMLEFIMAKFTYQKPKKGLSDLKRGKKVGGDSFKHMVFFLIKISHIEN